MSTGTIKYVGTTDGYLTNNKNYTILELTPGGGTTPAGFYVILADNNKPYSVDSTDANFSLVELYALTKVV